MFKKTCERVDSGHISMLVAGREHVKDLADKFLENVRCIVLLPEPRKEIKGNSKDEL